MEKTKLGISTALLAAILWLLGYYGGYVITVIAIGYVLLAEESASLKRTAGTVLVFMLAFSLAGTALNLIPNLLSWVQSIVSIFSKYGYIEALHNNFFTRFLDFISTSLSLVKMVVFLLMGFMSLLGKKVKIPALDKVLDKCLSQ